MAIYLMLIAACFTSAQNLCMRKSVDAPGSTNLYVPLQLAFSCLAAILLNPVRMNDYIFNIQIIGVGACLGLLIGTMMFAMGQSFKHGPAALTIALLNSSSVLPAALMAGVFGAAFGHPYQLWNGVGSIIVVLAMFSSVKNLKGMQRPFLWVIFVSLMITAYVFFSAGLQWKVILETSTQVHFFLPFKLDPAGSAWLMPSIFFFATLVQFLLLPFVEGEKIISKPLLNWAFWGGLTNGCSMFFMVYAAEQAWGWQNAILYPTFSIGIIILCNIWGKYLYEEKILWVPNVLASLGLIVGAVHWSSFCN